MGNSKSIGRRPMVSASQFENLPCEILFNVIDYVPELVYDLRLCSKTLKSRIDQYAVRPGIKLVKKLTIHSALPGLSNTISITVYESTKKLFELHLKLLSAKYGFKINMKGIASSMEYRISFTDNTITEPMLSWFQYCMGNAVGTVELLFSHEYNSWSFFYHLLEQTRFKNLRICTHTITEESASNILKLIGEHSVDDLYIHYVKNTLNDPSKFLIDVSTIVRALQLDPQEKDELSNLLGIHKPDESIILDMFSRKLDKLSISTYSHDELLPEEWADAICERLPYLDKKVWFKVTGRLINNIRDAILNDHIVRGSNCELIIKHTSRKNEQN